MLGLSGWVQTLQGRPAISATPIYPAGRGGGPPRPVDRAVLAEDPVLGAVRVGRTLLAPLRVDDLVGAHLRDVVEGLDPERPPHPVAHPDLARGVDVVLALD